MVFWYSKSPMYEPSCFKLSKMQTWDPMSGVYSLKWLCSCILCCTALYRVQYSKDSMSLCKPGLSRSKHKSSSDVAGTAKKHQELEAQRKDKGKQEEQEVTEEPVRVMMG